MNEFLAYVRKRRAELERELADLNAAERIYRESGSGTEVYQMSFMTEVKRPSIKEMAVEYLREAEPRGLTALQILDRIQKAWMPGLKRTSLSPQLSRLRGDGVIYNKNGVWKLREEDTLPGPSDGIDLGSNGVGFD